MPGSGTATDEVCYGDMIPSVQIIRLLAIVITLVYTAVSLAHTPVPLQYVPTAVISAVAERMPDLILTEAAVDVEGNLITYVVVGAVADKEYVIEVTAEGTLIQIHDKAYYEEHLED
jgi:hypothetical protein